MKTTTVQLLPQFASLHQTRNDLQLKDSTTWFKATESDLRPLDIGSMEEGSHSKHWPSIVDASSVATGGMGEHVPQTQYGRVMGYAEIRGEKSEEGVPDHLGQTTDGEVGSGGHHKLWGLLLTVLTLTAADLLVL